MDRDYRRVGPIDAQKLFVKIPMLELCRELLPQVDGHIEESKAVLHADSIPEVNIGPCYDEPYKCRFKSYCFRNAQDGYDFRFRDSQVNLVAVGVLYSSRDALDLTDEGNWV